MKPYFFILVLAALSSQAQEKSVKVNGNNYNVFVKGFENRKATTPVIIFENGMGMGLDTWNTVIGQLSKVAPVFSYDRASVGKSDKTYEMPTVNHVSENLKAILNDLKIAPPYLLVGHSMGGIYIRGFAGLYPNDVSGLVFIDPADFTETKENWNAIFRKIGVPEQKIDEMLYKRLYQSPKVDSLNYGPWSESQVLGELRKTDFLELNDLPLPNVPIYFFVGGKFEVPVDRRSKDFDQEAFFNERTNVNIQRWRKFIYSSGKGGNLIYLSKSGHFLHLDNPNAVIGNIKMMLEELESRP